MCGLIHIVVSHPDRGGETVVAAVGRLGRLVLDRLGKPELLVVTETGQVRYVSLLSLLLHGFPFPSSKTGLILTVSNPASRAVPSPTARIGSGVESSKNGVWRHRLGAPQPLARLQRRQFGHAASPNGGRRAVPLDTGYATVPFASSLSFGPGDPDRRSRAAQPDSRRAWLVAERHAHVARSALPPGWRLAGQRAIRPHSSGKMNLKRIGSSIDRNPASLIWPLQRTVTPPHWPVCIYQTEYDGACAGRRLCPRSSLRASGYAVSARRTGW